MRKPARSSRSMTFGTTGYTKADYARTLAATLAYFLSHQGDATGLLTFDEQVREYLPARNRPGCSGSTPWAGRS